MSYRYSRDVQAGCFQCHNGNAHWRAKNAQGVAARHAKATGHETWVEVVLMLRYGAKDKPQPVEQKK